MKITPGMRTEMNKNSAKWHLDHPYIYGTSSKQYYKHDNEHLLHILCCMGEVIYGTIQHKGSSDCWKVKFEHDDITVSYYVDAYNLIFSEIYRLL